MKNELLLTSILLANPVSAMTDLNLQDAISISKDLKEEKAIGTFKFPKVIDGYRWERNGEEWEQVFIKETVELELVALTSGQPSYYDEDLRDYVDVEMDYELNFITRNIADESDTSGSENYFYVKKIRENRYRLFDCDSSANCRSSEYMEFAIYDTPKGKILKVKKAWQGAKYEALVLNLFKKNDVLFEVK